MKLLFDCATLRQTAAPLTNGRPGNEYAYIKIDGERHEVDVYVTEWTTSCGDQSGTVGCYPLSPLTDGPALAAFLGSRCFRILAARIIAGTRIETVDGRTVGFADGDARAAETELVEQLRHLPDHEIEFCRARRWLTDQGDFLDVWPNGPLDEAAERLEPAFEQILFEEGIGALARSSEFGEPDDVGNVSDELMKEAFRRFERGDELYRCHVEALAYFRQITEKQFREWEEAKAETTDE